MDCAELRAALEAAGCSESNYSIGCRNDDTFAIERFGDEWWVFYTERGIVNEPEFRSPSESEACQYLWEKMQTMRHHHLIGAFTERGERDALLAWLNDHGIEFWCNDIPAPVLPTTLYRVFVFGPDIFRVRALRGGEKHTMICLEHELSETEIAALGEPSGRVTKANRVWCEALKTFKRQMKPGDRLWDFDTSPESWANLGGSRGLVILRGFEIVGEFIFMEN